MNTIGNIVTRFLISIALIVPASASAAEWVAMGRNADTYGARAGCTVLERHEASGLTLLECTDAQAKSLINVRSLVVAPNATLNMIPPVETWGMELDAANPPFTGDDDFFFDFQWGHAAIQATSAWETGARGAGVRVAVIDSGIDCLYSELAPNINYDLAISLIPGQHWCDVIPFNHGTHVAGTIAAPDDGYGVIGVAPEAEIVPIKVCDAYDPEGSCDEFAIWMGMLWAADVGADIANMSLGGAFPRSGFIDEDGRRINGRDVQAMAIIYSRIATYANQAGTTIIAAAGNEGVNANFDRDLMWLPAQAPHVLAVSALSPHGWMFNPFTDLDVPTSYTNHGESLVDLSAPGGDVDPALLEWFYNNGAWDVCMDYYGVPCFAFDLVLSTDAWGYYSFAAGTSMAAPHVAGVAALVLGANPDMSPGDLKAHLKATADDLGPEGRDAYFGIGRVNAYRAVTE